MVGFGQTICLPIGPMCHECLNNDICPSRGLARKSPKKTPKKSPVKEENNEALGLLDVKKELDLDKSPKKRKVSPKQKQQVKQEDKYAFEDIFEEATTTKAKKTQENRDEEMDDFENKKIHIPVKIEKKKASPQTRNIVKKEQHIENSEVGKKNVTLEAKKKDAPKKHKVALRKPVQVDIVDESQSTSSTKSNHNKLNVKRELKRKSPKPNKTEVDIESVGEVVQVNKKETKAIKK